MDTSLLRSLVLETHAFPAHSHIANPVPNRPKSNLNFAFEVKDSQRDSTPQVVCLEWNEFSETLQKPLWIGKDTLAKFKADTFKANKNTFSENFDEWIFVEEILAQLWRPIITYDTNGKETPANIKGISALVFDVKRNMSADEVCLRLKGIKALVHSTYQHSPDDSRIRVIIPTSSPIPLSDWELLLEYFQYKFDGNLDLGSSPTPYHFFRFPACPSDGLKNYTIIELKGNVFDRLLEMQRVRAAKNKREQLSVYDPEIAGDASVPEPSIAKFLLSENVAIEHLEEANAIIAKTMRATPEPTQPLTQIYSASPEVTKLHTVLAPSAATTFCPTAVAPSTMTAAEEAVDCYSFPAYDMDDDHFKSDAALADRLETLVIQVSRVGPGNYLNIRKEYCELSILINQRCLWAPGFRPELMIPWKKSERTASHTLIQRDRIVIDCHWLHAKGHKIRPERQWRPLFNLDTSFPFGLCDDFACRNVKGAYRGALILGLTARQQLQTRSLRSEEVSARIEVLTKRSRIDGKMVGSPFDLIKACVDRWCEVDPRIGKDREKYLAHAQAKMLLANDSPTWKEVAALGGLIQGARPLGEKTVSDFLKKFYARMVKAASPSKSA